MPEDNPQEIPDLPQPEHRKSSVSYRSMLESLLAKHGSNFSEFTHDFPDLVDPGRQLLSTDQATGFNLVKSREYLPLDSDKPLIFYNRYIHEIDHLVEVLETMTTKTSLLPTKSSSVLRHPQLKMTVIGSQIIPAWP